MVTPAAVRICVHSGKFHADDAFSVAAVKAALALYGNGGVEVRRSRHQFDIDWANVVIDVGGKYATDEDGKAWYDHHQVGGAGTHPDGIPYAAFGLIWRKYGVDCVRARVSVRPIDHEVVNWIVEEMLHGFVAAVDAADNGYDLTTSWRPTTSVRPITVGGIIDSFNSDWDNGLRDDPSMEMLRFDDACSTASLILTKQIRALHAQHRAMQFVRGAYVDRTDRALLVLSKGCPWQHVLLDVLKDTEVQYVVFPEPTTGWMVQAVPTSVGATDKRRPLPAPWGGLRDGTLSAVTGVIDAVFCHRGLFICGAKSFQGAIDLAEAALRAA